MRVVIADEVRERYLADDDISLTHRAGEAATADTGTVTCDARWNPAPRLVTKTHTSSQPASRRLARSRSNAERVIGAAF